MISDRKIEIILATVIAICTIILLFCEVFICGSKDCPTIIYKQECKCKSEIPMHKPDTMPAKAGELQQLEGIPHIENSN